MHPDVSLQKFVDIRNEFSVVEFSETDTRVKIIDRIFKECLNWSEKDITREDHVETGFSDYQLRVGKTTRLVIEAKRTGVSFSVPDSSIYRRYKLNGVISKLRDVDSAIKQVQSYCNDVGCKHCLITNGQQFIIFTAISIGKPWREGEAICFHSLDDVISNYGTFFDLLSRNSVVAGSLSKHLDQSKTSKIFKVVLSNINDNDSKWARNPFYTYINPLSSRSFYKKSCINS